MERACFARIEELFHAALERPVAEREGFVAASEPDVAVRAKVLSLLAREAESDSALRGALDAALAAPATAATQIGPYRVLAELGVGGMGRVLLAERTLGDTRQRVALKLIRGFPTAAARERLARERNLLAGLNHPNIARLLDAGETSDGVPYLAMEYIDGAPLPAFCTAHALDLRARLRLFAQLCRAVQHAHQRLIVHRDIKPGNILVREDGTPVLLDFGIGKLLDASGRDSTATHVFTPAYAAPEQRAGRGVTTAADIYGLGCVLHELLTERPLREVAAGAAAPLPSAVAADNSRARALRGDLDTLAAKALQEEPERRYPSAQAFADDVENYLCGKPLRAAPDSAVYRARKFLRRHRVGAGVALLGAVLAVLFVWRLDAERQRALAAEAQARQQARYAQQSSDLLLSVFAAAAPENTRGNLSVRELIDIGKTRLDRQLPEQPLLRARLLATFGSLYVSLGDPQAAATTLEPALALVSDTTPEQGLLLAEIDEALGLAYDRLDRAEASLARLRAALDLRERYAAQQPAVIAKSLQALGYYHYQRAQNQQARDYLNRALALREQAQPHDELALIETRRVLALNDLDLGEITRAENEAEQALTAARRTLPAHHPDLVQPLLAHAVVLIHQAQFAQAAGELEEALAICHQVLGPDSVITTGVERSLGTALDGLGRFPEALTHFEAALAAQQKLRAGDPLASAEGLADIGVTYSLAGDYAQAEKNLRDAEAGLRRAYPEQEPEVLLARSNLARVLSLQGRHAQARAMIDNVLAGTIAARGEQSERHGFELLRSSMAYWRAGNLDQARRELDRAIPLLARTLPERHPWRVQARIAGGEIALANGDADAAAEEFEQAVRTLAAGEQPGQDYGLLNAARVALAEAEFKRGRREAAIHQLAVVAPTLAANYAPQSFERRRADALKAALSR